MHLRMHRSGITYLAPAIHQWINRNCAPYRGPVPNCYDSSLHTLATNQSGLGKFSQNHRIYLKMTSSK